ncbi:response regulator [Pontibacter pamirensis]|uniref:response regulator n=1 Tax=Pontibacter pamirensis TaxID=2562824 RepID=UPI0013895A0C|nr:response regulator [Pontibacter pamirensis]
MEFAKQVIQTDPNPTYVKNEHGKFVLANAAYADLHGLTVEEMLTKDTNFFDYSYERDLELLRKNEALSIEELYKLKNGEKKWFNTIKKTFTQPDGTRYLLSVSSDITLLKSAVQAAEESARSKESFLASLSNEISISVSAISGIVKLMKKSLLNKDQEGYLDTITSIADNLLVPPSELLEVAKLEAGEVKTVTVPFEISTVIGETVRAVACKEQGVKIHYNETVEKIPMVEGDPFLLSQVLIKLINNAIKYMRHGEMTVSVERLEISDDMLHISCCLKETDVGFSAANFKTVHDTLIEEQSILNQLYNGTGLGLTIAKKLLELQKGKLWLENKPGQGNCFYFSIPYTLSKSDSSLNKVASHTKSDQLNGLRILIAEDNHLNELLLTSQLKPFGIDTDIAYNGEQALVKANETKYDLILMDIQMPKLDGIKATYEIRNKQSLNEYTPIIALTADFHEIDEDRYKYYGFTDCMLKPYPESKLLQIIACYAGRKTAPQNPTPHKAPNEESTLYDFSGLGNLKDDALFIRRMQQMFVETVPLQLDELEEAIERKELSTAAHIAHKLKSTFGNIKIMIATEAVKRIEEHANSKTKMDEMLRLMQIVREEVNKVIRVFSNQLHI